ncbi:MAG: tyrosine-type recombinase/integrase [Oscillospiraceae bacterium]|jgi:integrase
MTVQEWTQHWLEACARPSVRPATLAAYRYVMQNHINPGLGEIELAALMAEDVSLFLEHCKTSGSHRPESAGYPGLSDETMRHIHRLLYQCLAPAVTQGLISENPANAFRCARSKPQTHNVLTADEVEAYLDAADELGHLPMFALELTCGLRQRELIALKWSDLDMENRTLAVAEQRMVECGRLIEYDTKTRTITLTEEVTGLLAGEHARHPSHPCMFVHPGTLKPYSPNMVRLLHSKIIAHAGLAHVRFVDLRHTCAALALKGGADARALANLLGHSRPSDTRKAYKEYLHMKEPEKPTCAPCAPSVTELQAAANKIALALNF